MSHRQGLALWLFCTAHVCLQAQTEAAFVDAATEATALRGPARSTAAGTALDIYLQLPEEARHRHVAAAAWCALAAEQPALAVDLAEEGRHVGRCSVELIGLHLSALVRLRRWVDWVRQARKDQSDGQEAAVTAALLSEEGALLQAADRLLRRGGDATEAGLWLFRALADARPGNAISLGNLALALRNVGSIDESERSYRAALQASPGDAELWNDFGLFLRATGREEQANEAFERSYSLDRRPGEGPGVTNLVLAGRWGSPGDRSRAIPTAVARASLALSLRPEAEMLRRITIDLLLDSPQAASPPSDLPSDSTIR
jgi:tetratricopeptide (TPR) repeat protein